MISSHRPALKAARRCIRPLTVVSLQNDPGALKRRLTTRRTVLSTWPEPIGSLSLSSVTYRMRCACGMEHRSEEHTSEVQSHSGIVCRLMPEQKNSITEIPYAV